MPATTWSASSAVATCCAGPPAECPRLLVRPEGFGQTRRIAFLDDFDEARAEVVPAKQRPTRAATQVQDAPGYLGTPRRWCAAVGRRARAVELFWGGLVPAAARTPTRVDHARGRVARPTTCFNLAVGPATFAFRATKGTGSRQPSR